LEVLDGIFNEQELKRLLGPRPTSVEWTTTWP